jgi:hypothetical protein
VIPGSHYAGPGMTIVDVADDPIQPESAAMSKGVIDLI